MKLLSQTLLLLAAAAPAYANKIEVRWLGSNPPFYGSGWRSPLLAQLPLDPSVATGWIKFDGTTIFTRGYSIFDLTNADVVTPNNYAVIAAQLELSVSGYESPDPTERVGVFDVSSSPVAVGAKLVIDPDIFEDLGTGRQYGSFDVSSDSARRFVVDLNGAAIRDINRQYGDLFVVGWSLLSAQSSYMTNERVYISFSHLKLLIDRVPEPSGAVMVAAAIVIWASPRHRFARRSRSEIATLHQRT
jgi:hypothetical protein